ncbi:MAG: hypothetical protein IIC96_16220 [Chloroflexi bacterium]|nr:hypothetical protein [Chloroflexota bacterium]
MDVVIQPGALASVELAPSPAVAQKGETVQLAAQGFDLFKNPIEGLSFVWGAEGLAIDQTGKVTAGNQEGRYTVTVRASYRGGQRTASVTVAVPPIWVSVGNMRAARRTPTATLLADGNVLIMGAVRLAELYDPATRSFSVTGAPFCRHSGSPQATLLANGSVLITGGSSDSRCAEIYDPQTKVFSRVGDLNADRWWHTATLLGNGKVLIAGGNLRQEGLSVSHAAAERFGFPAIVNSMDRQRPRLVPAANTTGLGPRGNCCNIGWSPGPGKKLVSPPDTRSPRHGFPRGQYIADLRARLHLFRRD